MTDSMRLFITEQFFLKVCATVGVYMSVKTVHMLYQHLQPI